MTLEGERVRLREERREDMQFMTNLRNDLDTQAWSKTLPPDYTEDMLVGRYEKREFSYDRNDGRFIIILKETGERAGSVVYSGLDPRWDVTIGIQIAKPFWGTGVAYETQELLLGFLFQELGVRVVRLWTHSGNPRAVGLAQKSGFQVSVRQRQSIFKDGELYDNLMMDLLREEYYALHPEMTDNLPPLGSV